ncbi:MAG: fibronectin type III domain-containing protein [Elusimicrobiales bacterium]|nr:fibronectin type III domain-containing protein [Elusimicrobiales bacterium]
MRALILLSLLLCAGPSWAGRYESASFVETDGRMGWGGALGYSSGFVSFSALDELSVSTSVSPMYSSRSGAYAYFPQPAAVSDLATLTVSSDSVRVTWTAPEEAWHTIGGSSLGYALKYSLSAPIATEEDFRSAALVAASQSWSPLAGGATETFILDGFNPGATYYFALRAYNSERVTSELSNRAVSFALTPLPPMNFQSAAGANSYSLSWIPPAGYATRIEFDNRFSPSYPYEVKAYQVFRATTPATENWAFIAEVSSYTFSFVDSVPPGSEYFYRVSAVNQAGLSSPSYVRGGRSNAGYFVAPDGASLMEIPQAAMGPFAGAVSDQLELYTIEVASNTDEVGGRIVKSVDFAAYRGGLTRDDSFKLATPGSLRLYYSKSGDAFVPSATVPDYKRLSVFFHNGRRWLQLYGKVDQPNSRVTLDTTLLGRYQLRSTERSGGFAADVSGLSNRLITPNGDGKNDTMVFVFDNPTGASAKGTIYDLKGARVASMTPGPVENSLVWDPRSEGRAAPGGVYIYQIESGGEVFNGTAVVIK